MYDIVCMEKNKVNQWKKRVGDVVEKSVEKPGPRYLLRSSGMYNKGNTEGADRDRKCQTLQNGKVKRRIIFIIHPSVDLMTPADRGLAMRYEVPMLGAEATGEDFGVEDAQCKGSKQYEER
ncbi:hypothetical protein K438DRAFT_1756023 [Mycena galopus ATCC 62051]|nr:hypothetical protein K438DRAFT_1756023 [Mycena galopus ATCC 62051]